MVREVSYSPHFDELLWTKTKYFPLVTRHESIYIDKHFYSKPILNPVTRFLLWFGIELGDNCFNVGTDSIK